MSRDKISSMSKCDLTKLASGDNPRAHSRLQALFSREKVNQERKGRDDDKMEKAVDGDDSSADIDDGADGSAGNGTG